MYDICHHQDNQEHLSFQCRVSDVLDMRHICYRNLFLRKQGTSNNLMYAGQITVCISKSRIDLDGPCIALQCTTNIAHFFQCITHIWISIRKCGRYTYRFFVMIDCILEFTLLLQYRCKVAMRRREFGVYLQLGKMNFHVIKLIHIMPISAACWLLEKGNDRRGKTCGKRVQIIE